MARYHAVQGKPWRIPATVWAGDPGGDLLDLTDVSCRMQLRRRWADDEPGVAPLLDLTSDPGGGITITVESGEVLTEVDEADTEAIPYGLFLAEWELSDGVSWQLEIEVAPEVVREVTP